MAGLQGCSGNCDTIVTIAFAKIRINYMSVRPSAPQARNTAGDPAADCVHGLLHSVCLSCKMSQGTDCAQLEDIVVGLVWGAQSYQELMGWAWLGLGFLDPLSCCRFGMLVSRQHLKSKISKLPPPQEWVFGSENPVTVAGAGS